jgi:hypothetical protein
MVENDMIPCCPYSVASIDIADSVFMFALEQSHRSEATQRGYRKNYTVLCRPPRSGISAIYAEVLSLLRKGDRREPILA